ncbi:MAG: hypothetical protein ACI9R3_002536 [Verrucomicrobiales bacterium]|jgi:hypothetical protein
MECEPLSLREADNVFEPGCWQRCFLLVYSIIIMVSPGVASAQEKQIPVAPTFPGESNGWTLASVLKHPPLKEASGFAASRVRPGVLWTHNDGGAGANVFAIESATGAILQTVRVPQVDNLDWEDAMTIVTGEGQQFVAIADIGDNEKRRRDCVIHLFQETASTLTLHHSIRFHYPDGKRYDSEAAAFDARSGSILVLTKSKAETLLFAIPLQKKGATKPVEAVFLTTLAKPDHYPDSGAMINLKRGIFGVSTTAADISPDGSILAILTYTECLLYHRAAGESWTVAVRRQPQFLPLPGVYQAEALCFSADGTQLFLTSEKTPSPLYQKDLGQ